MAELYSRSWELQDIEIMRTTDGRTVEAYATVFDSPTEIRDQYGHYNEIIHRGAFNRTLKNNGTDRTQVLYNHGLDNFGKSGGLAQVPIGKALEITADSHGLKTVTRYNNSDLADHVLESIKNGEITGQSFRGAIYKSNPEKLPRVRPGAALPTVTRMELGLSDYGPTPSPAYKDAYIVAVRSQYSPYEIDEIIRLLQSADSTRTPAPDDSVDRHSTRDLSLLRLRAKMILEGIENG